MTELTPAMENAFRLLGVTPDADHSKIRSAWKAMVRAYHPDQVTEDKGEANRRLAEMNSAFDLVSAWSPEDARTYVAARAKRRAAQNMASRNRARQAEAERKAAEEKAADLRKREAGARSAAEKARRRRAAELDLRETAKRSARASKAKQHHPEVAIAREMFLAAMLRTGPKQPTPRFWLCLIRKLRHPGCSGRLPIL